MDVFNNTTDAFSSENWRNASSAVVEYATTLRAGDDPLEKVALASEILDHITAAITIIGFIGELKSVMLKCYMLLSEYQFRMSLLDQPLCSLYKGVGSCLFYFSVIIDHHAYQLTVIESYPAGEQALCPKVRPAETFSSKNNDFYTFNGCL